MSDFVSEDDIETFEGWLKGTQGIDPATASQEILASYRELFDELTENPTPKIGEMKFPLLKAGERRYAVAIRDSGLWITLWIRCSPKGEFFVMLPRGDRSWDPHVSYHLDGTFHSKSHGRAGLEKKLQPLTGSFRGTEHLGAHGGHGPKTVGAVCDPAKFTDILEIPSGVLGLYDGQVVVDLVEPGCEPITWYFAEVARRTFKDAVPWVVVRVGMGITTRPSKLVPVYADDGNVLLYDIYVDNEWLGSRRTLQQCRDQLKFLDPHRVG